MNHINGNRLGLALGGLFGLVHLLWALLVLAAWAQPLLNFVVGLHFMVSTSVVGSFEVVTALELVALAAIVGYVLGQAFAFIWNSLNKS